MSWRTRTSHHGLNSDWTKQVRPIGTVKALMIFVDFPHAQAVDPNPNQGGYDWRVPQSYWDLLKPAAAPCATTSRCGSTGCS